MFRTSGRLRVICVSVLASVTLGACGGDDDTAKELSNQQELEQARKEGARDERLKRLERELRQERRGADKGGTPRGQNPTPAPAPAGSPPSGRSGGGTSCGDGVSVGPNTSCPFAREVRAEYPGSGGSFEVYSSVTGKTYTMSCTGGSPKACRGGNGASVFFP